MKSQKLPVLGFTIFFCCLLPGRAGALTLDEAAKASHEGGRPLLIVAGRHTCGLTTAVLRHLQEPALATVLSPYVNVFVDVDGPEGRTCQQKYGSPGNMLPFVYVVRADGEKLYSHSGILQSEELRDVLLSEAAKAGRSLSAKETALVKKAIEEAKRARKKGDTGEAVKALLPLKKIGPLGNIDCFTGPGAEANQLVATLTEEGKTALGEVGEKLSDGNATFAAALAYAKAKRTYAPLTTLKTDLAAAARKYEHLHGFADTLRQAEALDRAQAAAASSRDPKKAADAFQRIVTAYPDTEAAKLAAEELKKLAGDGAAESAADAPKSAYRTWTDTTGQFSVKARCRGAKDGKLSLETEDGRVVQVPIEKLSEPDRKFLKSQSDTE